MDKQAKKTIIDMEENIEDVLDEIEQLGNNNEKNENDVNHLFLKIASYIKLSCFYFIILSLQKKEESAKDNHYTAVRKNLNMALSLFASFLKTKYFSGFNYTSDNKEKLYQTFDLLEIINWLKIIGFQIDRLNNLLDYSSKLKISVISLKDKYSLVLINAIDFKNLIKKTDVENSDYYKYQDFLSLTKSLLEEIADEYWNMHMKNDSFNESTLEITKGIEFLNILNQLNIYTNDRENKERIDKRITSWVNYKKSLLKKNK